MEQRCHVAMIWLTWSGLPALAIIVGWRHGWLAAAVLLAVGVLAQILYIRQFPHLSRWMGYGSVEDVRPAVGALDASNLQVTLYTASACPFCPIVRRRLADLQTRHGFELRQIDVTFRPEILLEKRIRSVPVIEANGRVLTGNVTSAEIAEFLNGSTVAA